jgi:trehalose-phosphatase
MSQDAISQFWAGLSSMGRGVLLLDYDGTLSPFRQERELAVPYPGVADAIERIQAGQQTRVVIVTGRNARDIPKLLRLEHTPEVWGSHGFERLGKDGICSNFELDSVTTASLSAISAWFKQKQLEQYIEKKPGCIAFHWRGLTENQTDALRAMVEPVMRRHATGALELREFDGGLELRAGAASKATVVDTVLREEPDTAAAYLGDDLTDEDAFRAIDGRGLAVLVRPEYRDTAAHAWLRPPDELLSFLNIWQLVLDSCRRDG